ncbi:uncharacterized protein LOC118438810 [Folsomia candida]|uniref:uncharacterized protein LOC118438810 n=1 Tax=Folsomia candida TaxID=158441 RepID=UPI0016051463|nr:uncharacterized protein LOC118438810 [Folsomia candida]
MISYQTHLQSSNHTLAVIGSSEIFAEDDQDKGLDSDHDEAQSDGHEDDENKAANGQLNQKKKKPRSKSRPQYIKNTDHRTQHAKRSGLQLVKKIKDYAAKTGAKVYLQTEYRGAKSSHTFSYGEYWSLTGEVAEKATITSASVKEAVEEAVKGTFTPILKEITSGSNNAAFSASVLSPKKHATSKAQNCLICGKTEVVKDFIVFDSKLIGCTGDGKNCSKWVHADCLGFPGITNKEIKEMPNYFCPDHLAFGRKRKGVKNHYVGAEPEPSKKLGKRGH